MDLIRKISAVFLLMAAVAVVGACTTSTGKDGKYGHDARAKHHSSGFMRRGDYTP